MTGWETDKVGGGKKAGRIKKGWEGETAKGREEGGRKIQGISERHNNIWHSWAHFSLFHTCRI